MKHPLRTAIQLQELLRILHRGPGLTQDQLAGYLGLDRCRISQIEGNPGVASFNQLSRIITILGGQLLVESIPDDNGRGVGESTDGDEPIKLLP